MIPETLTNLALRTLQDPQDAARQLLTMNLSRDALWTALSLVAVVNTALFMASLQLSPEQAGIPNVMRQPLPFFVIMAGSLVVIVHGLFWTGRALGGTGDLGDLLCLVIWLQALRAVGQTIVLIAMFGSLGLAAILSMGMGLYGFWILLNFIAVALRFSSLWPAIATLVVGVVGVFIGAVVLISLILLVTIGAQPSV